MEISVAPDLAGYVAVVVGIDVLGSLRRWFGAVVMILFWPVNLRLQRAMTLLLAPLVQEVLCLGRLHSRPIAEETHVLRFWLMARRRCLLAQRYRSLTGRWAEEMIPMAKIRLDGPGRLEARSSPLIVDTAFEIKLAVLGRVTNGCVSVSRS